MGLKSDILQAKKEALKAQDIEIRDEDFGEGSSNEIEARYMTEAFVNFLTHDNLHFTVSKLKASVELEEFNVSDDMDANIKMTRTIGMLAWNIKILKMIVQLIMAPIKWAADQEIAEVKPLSGLNSFIQPVDDFFNGLMKVLTAMIPKTEGQNEIEIPALDFRKDGGKHGGELDGRGHAYVGIDDPVKNSDTMDPDSDDNSVELYRDKIPDELLA